MCVCMCIYIHMLDGQERQRVKSPWIHSESQWPKSSKWLDEQISASVAFFGATSYGLLPEALVVVWDPKVNGTMEGSPSATACLPCVDGCIHAFAPWNNLGHRRPQLHYSTPEAPMTLNSAKLQSRYYSKELLDLRSRSRYHLHARSFREPPMTLKHLVCMAPEKAFSH